MTAYTADRETLTEALAAVGWVTPDTPDGPALVKMRATMVARHLTDTGAVQIIDPTDDALIDRLAAVIFAHITKGTEATARAILTELANPTASATHGTDSTQRATP